MLVSMWMTRDPTTVTPETTVADAAHLMARARVGRLPVVAPAADGGSLVGLVSAGDLERAFPPDINPFAPGARERGPRRPVSEVMTRQVKTVAPGTPIEEAARLMREANVGALPVLQDGRLVGIITESDIFRAFIELVGARQEGVRVTFDLTTGEDVVATMIEIGRRHGMWVSSVLSFEHEGRRLGVVRLRGPRTQAFLDAVWKSGHRVLSVLYPEAASPQAAGRRLSPTR